MRRDDTTEGFGGETTVDAGATTGETATEVEALPIGAQQIDPLASMNAAPDSTAARVRDRALRDSQSPPVLDPGGTAVDMVPEGAKHIDPEASINASPNSTAAMVRDQALAAIKRDDIDVDATIISKRAGTAAEQVRDRAFEFLRASEAARDTIPATTPAKPKLTTGQRPAAGPDEATLDALDDALVARLRQLPAEGIEPDWKLLEAGIRRQTGSMPTYVPWWKSWRYLVPLGGLAVTAMIAMIVINTSAKHADRTSLLTAPRDAGVTERGDEPVQPVVDHTPALWLDGQPVEIGDVEPDALDAIAPDDTEAADAEPGDDDGDGILPLTDFGWIDALDDESVARAERWLARKRS